MRRRDHQGPSCSICRSHLISSGGHHLNRSGFAAERNGIPNSWLQEGLRRNRSHDREVGNCGFGPLVLTDHSHLIARSRPGLDNPRARSIEVERYVPVVAGVAAKRLNPQEAWGAPIAHMSDSQYDYPVLLSRAVGKDRGYVWLSPSLQGISDSLLQVDVSCSRAIPTRDAVIGGLANSIQFDNPALGSAEGNRGDSNRSR